MQRGTGESFPRSSRLGRAGDYKRVFGANIRLSDDCFTLLIGRHQARSPRLGLAIAKKQVDRAVDRNRVKRLIRESFRRNKTVLPKRDLVVMVRKKVLELDNHQILQRLEKHWQSVAKKCENL